MHTNRRPTAIKLLSVASVISRKFTRRGLLLILGLAAGLLQPAYANQMPVCDSAYAVPDELWPPNHSFKTVDIRGVSDPDKDPLNIVIHCVRQDEHANGVGDGNTTHMPRVLVPTR